MRAPSWDRCKEPLPENRIESLQVLEIEFKSYLIVSSLGTRTMESLDQMREMMDIIDQRIEFVRIDLGELSKEYLPFSELFCVCRESMGEESFQRLATIKECIRDAPTWIEERREIHSLVLE